MKMKTIIELKEEIKMLEKDFNIKESDFDDFIYHTEKVIEIQTLKDVLEVIDEWANVECIDKKEKCHECIIELKQKIAGDDKQESEGGTKT